MRSACVLRQLGRCANPAHIQLSQWASRLPPSSSGPLRRELIAAVTAGCGGIPYSRLRPRSFTSSSYKRSWRLTPPEPPSVHPDPHDSLPLPEQLRSVMRLLPHSVVVCTATSGGPPDNDDDNKTKVTHNNNNSNNNTPRGMTMSSFTSLSLHPTPIITLNIATPSRTLDAIALTRRFNIHVLSGDVDGARVAEWFRRGNADGLGVFDAGKMKEGCGCEEEEIAAIAGKETEAPLLRGKGVLYAMRCKLLDDAPSNGLVRVRDHVVVLAEVLDMVEGKDKGEVFGLSYADRRYRQVGGTIVNGEGEG